MTISQAEPKGTADEAAPASILPAIGYKLASAALFTCMSALIKQLGDQYPVGQIVFVRSFFAMIPVLWLVHRLGGFRVLRTERLGGHLRRSGSGLVSMFCGFTALSLLPLATATALGYAAPMFITILAIPLLGETVRIYRWSAVVMGFIGVLLVVHPSPATGISFGALVALAGALATAFAMVSIRKMADTESNVTIVFYFTLSGAVVGAATLPFVGVWPDLIDIPILVTVGVLGGIAQILMTKAYQLAPASVIAPFDYASLIFALGLGFLAWGEFPTPIELLGTAVIVSSSLFIAFRERQRRIVRPVGKSM
jgi:drug/metabolite transporter (DMT)-like permease